MLEQTVKRFLVKVVFLCAHQEDHRDQTDRGQKEGKKYLAACAAP